MTRITSKVLRVWDLFTGGAGRFFVPWHQRYYDWENEQVKELLQDIKEALEADRQSYFVGSIMLVLEDYSWGINDGQQRLITLSLIVASLCRRFAHDGECQDRVREVQALRLLFDLSDKTVEDLSNADHLTLRIKPPKQDAARFSSIVRGHNVGTNGKMTSAWEEINGFVSGLENRKARKFFDFLLDKVEVGVLDVPKTEDTNAIFEALNGRGKTLAQLDLIRNHLYSYFADQKEDERRKFIHDSLETATIICRNSKRSEEYFRCFFQCEYGFLQKKRFYRETRAKIQAFVREGTGNDYVYDVVQRLSNRPVVNLFRNFSARTPDEDVVNSFLLTSNSTSKKRNLRIFLAELRPYTVAHPIMFALLRRFITELSYSPGYRRMIARRIHRCLSDLASFVMRITFCQPKFEPSRYETAFANCARRISTLEDMKELSILADLRACDDLGIVDNKHFKYSLSAARIANQSSMKRAKRLLFGINAQEQIDESVLDFDGCTVEHILPQSMAYQEGWDEFSKVGTDPTGWIQQIGNLTLLGTSSRYSSAGFNANFDAKKLVYGRSLFKITQDIAKMDCWTPKTVERRSRKLASAAAKVWSFSREDNAR